MLKTSEDQQYLEPNIDYVRSVAHHEAGHLVVGVVQGLRLLEHGIHIDRRGNGLAHIGDRKPDRSRNIGPESEREKAIVAAFAGWISQNKVFPMTASAGAHHDVNQINDLLDEMYSSRSYEWWAARGNLGSKAERLVNLHWNAIDALAVALWSKPESPRTCDYGSPEPDDKCLSPLEIAEILKRFGINPKSV